MGGMGWRFFDPSPRANRNAVSDTSQNALPEDLFQGDPSNCPFLLSPHPGNPLCGRVGYWYWEIPENRLHCSNEILAILGLPSSTHADSYGFFADYVHPDDRLRWLACVKAMIKCPADTHMTYRVIRPDERICTVRQACFVTRGRRHEPLRIVGTVVDVTDNEGSPRDVAAQLDSMTGFDRLVSIGTLASGVAHEINNPNQSILAFSEFLLEAWRYIQPVLDRFYRDNGDFMVAGYDYSECRNRILDALQGQLASSRRIDTIARELRTFARTDTVEPMGVININAVVRSATVLVSNLVRKSTDTFDVRYDSDSPPVRAHFQRIEQVLINLIQNACHALPGRHKGITVAVAHNASRKTVTVSVRDDGIGIAPEHLEHITEPFFTSKWNSGGNGLGLWVSSEIVRRHGGRLEFVSALGQGTTATVILPAASGAAV